MMEARINNLRDKLARAGRYLPPMRDDYEAVLMSLLDRGGVALRCLVAYHAGEEKPYNCGTCHTTGYNPEGENELPGIVGTWAEPGIRCEECHGPGAGHVDEGGEGPILK